jgi:Extensin-like protein C-terminus
MYFAEASRPPILARTPCPEPRRTATERCISPQPCEAIPDLMCVRNIDGIGFERVLKGGVTRDSATGMEVVTPQGRKVGEIQKMVPRAIDALERFVRNMTRFGMPIEAILTAGSLNCRCSFDGQGRPTNNLSDHSRGEAVDITGVRWRLPTSPRRASLDPPGRLRETIVHNFNNKDRSERTFLRRIDACLRLSFPNVIDYHNRFHRDHFHGDFSTGPSAQENTIRFTQEILGSLRNRPVAITGKLDVPTRTALQESFGWNRDPATLRSVLELLFTGVASGRL